MGNSHALLRAVVVAGAVLMVSMLSRGARAEQPLQVARDANSLVVQAGSATLLRYQYANVPFKPYVKELLTPNGLNVLLDAPPDHLHHHALMFACAVNNVDFWGEAPGSAEGHFERLPGKQIHEQLWVSHPPTFKPGLLQPPFEQVLHWCRQGEKEALLVERRFLTARFQGEPNATLVTWKSELAVPEGKESAVLSGSHYHGLGMRFVRAMDANGEFRNPDNDPGVIFRGEERLARSRWCAYTARVDGNTVTAAIFDHPSNPRPATWFMMAKPFAYLSATMRLHEEPLKVLSGQPLILRYGVALWDGRPETAQIDELYRQWVAMTPDKNAGQ